MALPERADDFERSERGPMPASGDASERPDWLVGADEGAEAAEADASAPVRPVLPAGGERPKPAARPAKPEAWKAAASSVPTLRRDQAGHVTAGPTGLVPAAKTRAETAPTGPAVGDEAWDDAFPADAPAPARDTSLAADGAPDDADAFLPALAVTAAAPARVPARPLAEPWWAIALDEVRTNRMIHVGLAVVAVGLALWLFWPRSTPSLSIGSIHQHPERFDGQTVQVRGRVGEVFALGGGYAFYLHQGQDTLVVFTRSRVPVSRENVSVAGSVSMGYLDGVARPALFESGE